MENWRFIDDVMIDDGFRRAEFFGCCVVIVFLLHCPRILIYTLVGDNFQESNGDISQYTDIPVAPNDSAICMEMLSMQ